MFVCYERESGRGAEREGERERIPSRLPTLSAEPAVRLNPMNCEIMTWAEIRSQTLTSWATQGPHNVFLSIEYLRCIKLVLFVLCPLFRWLLTVAFEVAIINLQTGHSLSLTWNHRADKCQGQELIEKSDFKVRALPQKINLWAEYVLICLDCWEI